MPAISTTDATKPNLNGCLLCYVSFHLGNGRHLILSVQNGRAGLIDAQPEYEIACRRWQPVGLMACRGGVLNINVDGAVGVWQESRPVVHDVPVDWVRHKALAVVSHSQRPECIVRRELSCREVHGVVMLSGERMTRTICGRRPVHRLLRL